MVSANKIREVISSYVRDGDFKQFVLEFSKLSFNIRQSGEAAAIDLSKRIEAILAEVNVGHMTLEGFRNSIGDVALAQDQGQQPERSDSTAIVVRAEGMLSLTFDPGNIFTYVMTPEVYGFPWSASGTFAPSLPIGESSFPSVVTVRDASLAIAA